MPLKSQALTAAKFIILALALAHTGPALGQSLTTAIPARFNLEAPAGAPFPSNWFTVVAPSHNTGRCVNLPKPYCATRPADCEDLASTTPLSAQETAINPGCILRLVTLTRCAD